MRLTNQTKIGMIGETLQGWNPGSIFSTRLHAYTHIIIIIINITNIKINHTIIMIIDYALGTVAAGLDTRYQ